jgi:hypothetical protein
VREISVVMHAGERPSTLHGGLRTVWYLYRMVLSLWAASSRRERKKDGRDGDARAPA